MYNKYATTWMKPASSRVCRESGKGKARLHADGKETGSLSGNSGDGDAEAGKG